MDKEQLTMLNYFECDWVRDDDNWEEFSDWWGSNDWETWLRQGLINKIDALEAFMDISDKFYQDYTEFKESIEPDLEGEWWYYRRSYLGY